MSVAWLNRPIIWVIFVVKMRRNRFPCNACYLRFVRALIRKPKLLTVALTVVRISFNHMLNIWRRPTLAVRAVSQSVHSAVCIFIFCVLISKDGPKRFQGSVIDGVMYILRTAIEERRCEPVLRGFAVLLHWYENSSHKYTFVGSYTSRVPCAVFRCCSTESRIWKIDAMSRHIPMMLKITGKVT